MTNTKLSGLDPYRSENISIGRLARKQNAGMKMPMQTLLRTDLFDLHIHESVELTPPLFWRVVMSFRMAQEANDSVFSIRKSVIKKCGAKLKSNLAVARLHTHSENSCLENEELEVKWHATDHSLT
jgi:hypothetical protein